jgi:hypothetical protein
MKIRRNLSLVCGVLLCASFGAAAAPAMTAGDLPPERQQGNIAYRTGGIGEDEAKAMQDAARQYPLTLEFAARTGEDRGGYLADVDVAIRDGHGKQVLQTRADGPFLLVRLPPGRYVVTAKHEDTQRSRRIDVSGRGAHRVVFSW